MTMDPSSLPSGEEPTRAPAPERGSSTKGGVPRMTRASAVWVATGAALLLLVMLIVFILQNPAQVVVHFIGLSGSLSLGMALLSAAVGGGVLVAIAGVARVTQLRMHARRVSRQNSGS